MRASMVQAGERMLLDCRDDALAGLIREACGDALRPESELDDAAPDLHLVVSDDTAPFATDGWVPLTRGAVHRDGVVVVGNACGSGFDLRVRPVGPASRPQFEVQARYRPPARERLAAIALRSRFHLLARAVLLQYPAMWAAAVRGRVPLHAAAVRVDGSVFLLAGPGGIGRSTLLLDALRDGAAACSDNLCVSDGREVSGVVEPVRIEGAGGRRMAYGRGECDLPQRLDSLTPQGVVVLERGTDRETVVRPITGERAAHVLSAGTYMAGELRRYWAFAATLALGTGLGAAHPPVDRVAQALCGLPCVGIELGARPTPTLGELVRDVLTGVVADTSAAVPAVSRS
jgi:hypothetical protein